MYVRTGVQPVITFSDFLNAPYIASLNRPGVLQTDSTCAVKY